MDHDVAIAESDAGHRAAVNTYHHRVGTRVSGRASQANECDEYASNVTMDKVTMNACEKEDQWSIELKVLVESGREMTFTSIL